MKILCSTLLTVCFIFVNSVHAQRAVGDRCVINYTNQPGICRLSANCPWAKQQFDQYGTKPTRCGFQGNLLVLCCGQEGSPPPTTSNNDNRFSGGDPNERISLKKCREYSRSVTLEVSALPLLPNAKPITSILNDCKYSGVELVVGGEPVKHGEFPHMAAIGWEKIDGGYDWNCGGSLISNLYVLTAGHCLYKEDTQLRNPEPTVVRLGENNIKSNNDGANPVDIGIESLIAHPEYRPPKKYNDIALIKLRQRATFGDYIRPACLWTKSSLDNSKAIATGWGYTKDGGSPSDVLQRVTLDIFSQRLCQQLNPANRKFSDRGIIDSQMCSGTLRGGQDTCGGDSGGPLQVQSESNLCIFHVIGVTSYGKTCGAPRSGGVYTRVSSYIDWIESQVWPGQ